MTEPNPSTGAPGLLKFDEAARRAPRDAPVAAIRAR